MAMISEVKQVFDDWIAAVTGAVANVAGRVVRSRQILLDEREDGTFIARMIKAKTDATLPDVSFRLDGGKANPPLSAEWAAAFRGSRVEVRLRADHVMISPLDFPSQAGDFLDGMIRAQIDRLTPWTAGDAVFGWSPPKTVASDRIGVVLAATSKRQVQPLLQVAQTLEAASVALFTESAGADAPARIKLLDKPLQSAIGRTVNVPQLLRVALLSAGVAAAASLLIGAYLGGSLQSEKDDLQHRIAQRRAALRLDSNGSGSGLGLLAKRKQTTPSSVMVLEAISRVLPDSTYVTELHIEGDKIQVVGMTQDAPSLVRLMEQSPQFTRATFFAPTTRAPNESGERFHIEAHITAYFGSGT